MEILNKSRELTPVELYQMTKSKSIISIKDVEDGEKITPIAHIFYTDVNAKGEESEMLSIMGKDGQVWAGQSKTFKEDFDDIASLFDEEEYTIIKQSGTSKSDRKFVYCVLDI